MESQYKIQYCPILHPTAKEFSNFQDYVNKVEKEYSQKFGMVKIVPPKKWKATDIDYESIMSDLKIPGPIEQNSSGKGGVYELLLIQKKSMVMSQYRKKSQDFENLTEGKSADEVEQIFWKNVGFSPPLYGADFMNSLFKQGVEWDMKHLKTFLSDSLPLQIQGVTYPYLYVGQWKSMFGWHKEDLDLGAINFVHHGKTKFWYCIAPSDQHKLEYLARQYFSEGFSKCQEYLRHKTILISPYLLLQKYKGDLKISKMEQNPGEFMLVFPGAYHEGFNWGFNIAEAVNYGSLTWLNCLHNAKFCQCQKDSVKIDKQGLLSYLENSKFKNDPEVKNFKQKLFEEEEKLAEKQWKKLQNQTTTSYQNQRIQHQQKINQIVQNSQEEDEYQQETVQIIQKTKPTSSNIPIQKSIQKAKKINTKKLIKKQLKQKLNQKQQFSKRIIKRPSRYSF